MNHPLIESHPNGVFPVLEVAKAIGQEATNLRRKAAAMNGQVNFNAESDTLNLSQLKEILPTYLTGQRQLKGSKRDAVRKLLAAIDGNVEEQGKPKPTTVKRQAIKRNNITSKEQLAEFNAPVNQLKTSFLTRQNFLLSVVGGLVFVQSSHFTLYYIDRIGGDGLTYGLTVLYGILIGLLVEAMGLILVANGRGRFWLAVIATVSFSVNILFYQAYKETGWNLVGEIILSLIIPGCIYLVSELYVDKSQ